MLGSPGSAPTVRGNRSSNDRGDYCSFDSVCSTVWRRSVPAARSGADCLARLHRVRRGTRPAARLIVVTRHPAGAGRSSAWFQTGRPRLARPQPAAGCRRRRPVLREAARHRRGGGTIRARRRRGGSPAPSQSRARASGCPEQDRNAAAVRSSGAVTRAAPGALQTCVARRRAAQETPHARRPGAGGVFTAGEESGAERPLWA